LRLAKELNLPIHLISTENSFEKVKLYNEKRKINIAIKQQSIEELDDFFLLNFLIEKHDLLVICSARLGSVSYQSGIDSFLSKMDKAFGENDRIIIYPAQEFSENLYTNYEDISSNAISKGVETIQKIGKEVGSIFRNKSDEE
jgi:hypothetical protein